MNTFDGSEPLIRASFLIDNGRVAQKTAGGRDRWNLATKDGTSGGELVRSRGQSVTPRQLWDRCASSSRLQFAARRNPTRVGRQGRGQINSLSRPSVAARGDSSGTAHADLPLSVDQAGSLCSMRSDFRNLRPSRWKRVSFQDRRPPVESSPRDCRTDTSVRSSRDWNACRVPSFRQTSKVSVPWDRSVRYCRSPGPLL